MGHIVGTVITAGDRRFGLAGFCVVALVLGMAAEPASATPGLANGCFAVATPDRARALEFVDGTYRAGTRNAAEPFWLKPTTLGSRYMLSDSAGRLLTASGGGVTAGSLPGSSAEWKVVTSSRNSSATLRHGKRELAIAQDGSLGLRRHGSAFRLLAAKGCRPYPEAGPGATGRPFRGTNPDGTVFGFADTHLHITADLRAGGRVIHGEPFDRFGITEALGHDEDDHGADGSDDVTGNLLRTGLPFGTHDTHGWPTFAGWPTNDTNTHQQVYYTWLQRAYDAGLRLVVAQTVEDAPICRIEPVRSHSCDETHTIKLEIQELQDLQEYVDAQSGGPGSGWFRLVRNPRQARKVIEQGKLAVVVGVESSDLFGCSEPAGCDRADVDHGLTRMRRLGVSTLFIAHWVDNAFAGSALEGGTKGVFINIFNQVETGHYFNTGPCPDPSQGEQVNTIGPVETQILGQFFPAAADIPPMPEYPEGKQCNTKGLTKLGAYLVRRMIDAGMLIEVDHMSELARDRVLKIAAQHHYPVVSGHTGTGGSWTPKELRTLYRDGGLGSATPDAAPDLARKLLGFRAYRSPRHYFGVGLGTDTGGFSSLPGPPDDAAQNPLAYPFKSYDGKMSFTRQHSGDRFFDLNTDGVAHYGLFADLLAEMQRGPDGPAAMKTLFRSAEAYLQMWELARARR